jgi:hypothetical protein
MAKKRDLAIVRSADAIVYNGALCRLSVHGTIARGASDPPRKFRIASSFVLAAVS